MNNNNINNILDNQKEQKRKDEIFLNIHKNDKFKKNIKETISHQYELGEEYFINTKTK